MTAYWKQLRNLHIFIQFIRRSGILKIASSCFSLFGDDKREQADSQEIIIFVKKKGNNSSCCSGETKDFRRINLFSY